MRRKKKTIECIEYLSVSAPLDKVDRLEDKQSKYIHEYVKNKEYMIVGTERRHGFSQNDVDRQWHQIVDKIRKKCLHSCFFFFSRFFFLSTGSCQQDTCHDTQHKPHFLFHGLFPPFTIYVFFIYLLSLFTQ